MKKSKIIPMNIDQLNDLKTMNKITEGLDTLDTIHIETPSQNWFEHFVLEQQRLAKEKWRKELFLFVILAIFILSGIVFSLYRMPIIFIILQGVGISIILIYSSMHIIKQVKMNEG
jgi:hypothetical protein